MCADRDDSIVQPSVDVVIPVLNEAHVIESSVATLRKFFADNDRYAWRIVIVENGSTDDTAAIGARLAAQFDDVGYLELGQPGRGRALRKAWTESNADVLCYTDVDLSTDLAALPIVVDAIVSGGYDLAVGTRLGAGSNTARSPSREFISRSYNLFLRLVLRVSFSDAQCGFKAIGRAAAHELVPRVRDQSWFFDTELLVLAEKGGYTITDVPVTWVEDDDSRVKIIRTAWDDIKGVLRLRRDLWFGAGRR
jgi:glycosyltransferase involved in cell wall biosynthesis